MGDRGLIPKQVQATRNGHTYPTTVWVRPEDNKPGTQLSGVLAPTSATGKVLREFPVRVVHNAESGRGDVILESDFGPVTIRNIGMIDDGHSEPRLSFAVTHNLGADVMESSMYPDEYVNSIRGEIHAVAFEVADDAGWYASEGDPVVDPSEPLQSTEMAEGRRFIDGNREYALAPVDGEPDRYTTDIDWDDDPFFHEGRTLGPEEALAEMVKRHNLNIERRQFESGHSLESITVAGAYEDIYRMIRDDYEGEGGVLPEL